MATTSEKYPARLRQPKKNAVGALRMLLACIDTSAATSYGDVKVLRAEDRGHWADAITAARDVLRRIRLES